MFQLLSAPFAYQNKAVAENAFSSRDWLGKVEQKDIGQWIDSFLLLLLGGIPWQVFSFFLLKPQTKVYLNTLRTGSFKLFKLFKCPFPGFLTILTL